MDQRPEKASVRNSVYAETASPFLPLLGGEKEKERDGGKTEGQQDVTTEAGRARCCPWSWALRDGAALALLTLRPEPFLSSFCSWLLQTAAE